jgi:hypothetical protein
MHVLKFILALAFGSALAALGSFVVWGSESFPILMVVGVAGTFAVFGFVPAVIFGLPALWLLQRLKLTPFAAALSMTVGGAAVGALVTFGIFKRFEPIGLIAGASISLMQGILLYRRKPLRVVPACP